MKTIITILTAVFFIVSPVWASDEVVDPFWGIKKVNK